MRSANLYGLGYSDGFSSGYEEGRRDALRSAAEAIEKQTPKKPKLFAERMLHCPSCGNAVARAFEIGYEYCMRCGQKLDWRSNAISKCTKENCPMQVGTVEDCDWKDCPYRTEKNMMQQGDEMDGGEK